MAEWGLKRFWTEAGVTEAEGGFAVSLDGRPVRTPAKAPLVAPTRAFAEAMAAEWQAQGERVDPASMPYTRLANSAIDNVARNHAEVAAMLAAYGGTDLLCYRADGPADLVARQAAAWNPLLDWADATLGAPLETGIGILHVPQPDASTARLSDLVHAMTPFELAAFHDLVALSGSLVLALAAAHGFADPEDIWSRSRIDEDWQAEKWGVDEEAAETAARKRTEFLTAFRAFHLIRQI